MANSLNKITTKSILDATVATADIAADAVTGAKIADNAIDSEHYTDGSIDTVHIADLNVVTDKIANIAVSTGKLADDAVTGDKLADDAVGAEHIEQLDSHLQLADNSKVRLGTGDDLDIYYNGTNGYITASAGVLYIDSDLTWFRNAAGNENYCLMNGNADVSLYYDNAAKLSTISTGINVTGGIRLGGNNAVNELDDYEEGTWTPGLSFGGGTTGLTYSHQTGFYTKIGRLVQCGGTIILSDSGTSTGDAELTGLPFTIGDNDATTSAEGGGHSTYWVNMGQNRQEHMLRGNHNSTTMAWWYGRDGGHSASDTAAESDWTDSSSIRFILTFQT